MALDKGLQGNETIEKAILALQEQTSQEMLAHALTVVRRRMKEGGQLIVAVDPSKASGQMEVQILKTQDGRAWWAAFTSFEEEMKGSGAVMSTFIANIRQLFEAAASEETICGIIINPWNRTLMLNKALIRIVLGKE